ncbi:MAG: hypothetical protein M1840_009082 [Geoglossum simile]|nr:MAG: hypothetical protein M1840_009082 [Geoglossum simile]
MDATVKQRVKSLASTLSILLISQPPASWLPRTTVVNSATKADRQELQYLLPCAPSPPGSPNPEKWVVRIPLPPCVAFADEKLESEIAMMRLCDHRMMWWNRHIVPAQPFIPSTWLTRRQLLDLCRYLEREDHIQELAR